MTLVAVRIITTVVTSQYGTLVNGDILRTSPEFARHLVEECKGAKYLEAQPEMPWPDEVQAKPKRRSKKNEPNVA